MELNIKKAEILKKEADTIYSKLFYFGNRYEDASEKYNKAAKIYKISKDYSKCCECLKKELECYERSNEKFSKISVLDELANVYHHIDKKESIKYYEKLIDCYVEQGKYERLSKIYGQMALIYEEENDYETCAHYLKKAGDMLYDDNQRISSVNHYDKLINVYIELNKYNEAMEIINNIMTIYQNQPTYFQVKYLFKLAVCKMLMYSKENQMDNFNEEINNITNNCVYFDNSIEHKLLESLTQSYLNRDVNEFTKLLKDYDFYKKLDDSYIKLFAEIKKNLMNNNQDEQYEDLT